MDKIYMATKDDVTSLGGNIAPIVNAELENVWFQLAAKGVKLPEDRSLASLAMTIAQLDDHGFASLIDRSVEGSVAIPDSVRSVGDHAMDSCDKITSVVAKECTEVGYSAFLGCTSLKSVSMPKLTLAGLSAFGGCAITDTGGICGLVTAGNNCFNSCNSLVRANLDNLTDEQNYPYGLFTNCENLEYVSLASLAFPDIDLFDGCEKLSRIVTHGIDDGASIYSGYGSTFSKVADGTGVWDVITKDSSVAISIFSNMMNWSVFQKKFHIWCKDGWLSYSDGSWNLNAYPDTMHEDSPMPTEPVVTEYGYYQIVDTETGSDMVHVFTNTAEGGFTIGLPENVGEVRYLVVGGGGGGGSAVVNWGGGGGGSGGFREELSLLTDARTATVRVGRGGNGGSSSTVENGENGGESSLTIGEYRITVPGGGGGGKGTAGSVSGSGASVGGGAFNGALGDLVPDSNGKFCGLMGAVGSNRAGGSGTTTKRFAGGGGGVNGEGLVPVQSSYAAGEGGLGADTDITGTWVEYCGGGGGGAPDLVIATRYSGGNAHEGGGRGGDYTTSGRGEDATNGTGGGGGGAAGASVSGGNGGSGIVVIRYKIKEVA